MTSNMESPDKIAWIESGPLKFSAAMAVSLGITALHYLYNQADNLITEIIKTAGPLGD